MITVTIPRAITITFVRGTTTPPTELEVVAVVAMVCRAINAWYYAA